MNRVLIIASVFSTLMAAGAMAGQPPASVSHGVLSDPAGLTLYVFDKDVAGDGRSVCNGPCAALWPPLMAEPGDRPQGEFSLLTRDDGSRQWAWRGKPLYRFAQDTKPGEQKGEGFKQLWHTVKP